MNNDNRMVLLTITPSILDALEKLRSVEDVISANIDGQASNEKVEATIGTSDLTPDDPKTAHEESPQGSIDTPQSLDGAKKSGESNLSNPKIGEPISHGQIIDIGRDMKIMGLYPQSLEILLQGSKVYIRPPPPKPEPSFEYKALMARLRREEEARSYERMTNPPPPMETFAQRFPGSSAAHAFSSTYQNINTSDPDDDGTTFADIDRQMALILNVLLSIVACAGAIWVAARWWSTPARLALSMSGSILVGVAEVVVYSGYIRRVGEAKGKEKKVKEIKEIVKTWVVGAEQDAEPSEIDDTSVIIEYKDEDGEMKARQRRKF